MLKDILSGMTSPQIQGMQQPMQMSMGAGMPMQQQQPMMLDQYGQQQGGLRQALIGRFMNARL